MSNAVALENWKGAYQSPEALPCPFCGGAPILVPWHGGPRTKRRVMCQSDDCPVEPGICGDTEAKALQSWNTRAE